MQSGKSLHTSGRAHRYTKAFEIYRDNTVENNDTVDLIRLNVM